MPLEAPVITTTANQREAPPVRPRGGVCLEYQAHALRIEKRHSPEIQDHAGEAGGLQPLQVRPDLIHRGDVHLPDWADTHVRTYRLHLNTKGVRGSVWVRC
jgi:hypothetical protein